MIVQRWTVASSRKTNGKWDFPLLQNAVNFLRYSSRSGFLSIPFRLSGLGKTCHEWTSRPSLFNLDFFFAFSIFCWCDAYTTYRYTFAFVAIDNDETPVNGLRIVFYHNSWIKRRSQRCQLHRWQLRGVVYKLPDVNTCLGKHSAGSMPYRFSDDKLFMASCRGRA